MDRLKVLNFILLMLMITIGVFLLYQFNSFQNQYENVCELCRGQGYSCIDLK